MELQRAVRVSRLQLHFMQRGVGVGVAVSITMTGTCTGTGAGTGTGTGGAIKTLNIPKPLGGRGTPCKFFLSCALFIHSRARFMSSEVHHSSRTSGQESSSHGPRGSHVQVKL